MPLAHVAVHDRLEPCAQPSPSSIVPSASSSQPLQLSVGAAQVPAVQLVLQVYAPAVPQLVTHGFPPELRTHAKPSSMRPSASSSHPLQLIATALPSPVERHAS